MYLNVSHFLFPANALARPLAWSDQITYDAKVTVPAWATCLMSALESAVPVTAAGGGKRTFSWKQVVPMPSYLIAVAVGELESREISSRCAD